MILTIPEVNVEKKRATDLGQISVCPDLDDDGFNLLEDCDDLNAFINPAAPELCDGGDNNCDGQVDEVGCSTCTDSDSDQFFAQPGCGSEVDCDDVDPTVHPGAFESCDGKDNNCNGVVDEGSDSDGDGYTTCEGDCNDSRADINPEAPEQCDERPWDEDCDGIFNEDCCGNGTMDWWGEECDDGNLSSVDSCRNDCNVNVCGDGWIYFGVEECDDGNAQPGDGCAPDCTLEVEGVMCFEDNDYDGYGFYRGSVILAPDGTCDAADGKPEERCRRFRE